MALSHLGAVGGQDIVVSEDVHTVVMPVRTRDMPVGTRELLFPSLPQQAHPIHRGLALLLYLKISPMTLVPHPGVAPSLGPEVSSSQVVNLGGESE